MAYQDLYSNYGSVNSLFGQDNEFTQANATPTTDTVTPVTQTIKIDPVTGEQKMTISGRPEDLTAANPYTPTVTMPTGGIRAEQPQAPGLQMPQAQMQPRVPPGSRIVPLEQAQAQEAAKPVVSPTDTNAEDIYQQLKQNFQQPSAPVAPMAQMAGGPATSDVNPPTISGRPGVTMPTGGIQLPEQQFPAAPAAPVAPSPAATTTPAPAPAAPVPPTTAPPTGPELTRQAESGGNYNVGYNRAGTSDAYGAYQILGSTYKEIQRLDPYFANKDQKSLTPAEQDRANDVVRRINSQGLAAEGAPVTEANLQLAHFLGAKGASDYLKTGYINPEAAAANGGYAKADQIARDRIRMAGGNPDIIPRNDQLNAQDLTEYANKKDLGSLMDIYKKDPTSAEGRAALASITTIQNQELQLEKAKKDIQNAMASQRGNLEIGKLLSAQKDEGSWGKYLLAGLLGMGDIAKAEGIKLGLNNTWQSVQLADGTSGMVQMRGDGLPIQGITDKGPMTPKELAESAAGAGGKTKPDVSTQDVQKGDLKGRVVTTYDRNNRPTTFVESGGKRYAYDASWTPVSIGTAATKAEQAAAIKLRYAGPMAYTSAGADYIGKFNAQYGTNLGYASQAPGAPLVDLNTGRVVTPDNTGNINVTQGRAPAGGGVTMGGTTTLSQAPAVVAGMTKSNQEYSDKLADNKNIASAQRATIDRLQASITRNPEFWGIDTNNPAWRAFVDVNSTNENRKVALDDLFRNMNIPKDKRAEFDSVMNDYRNLQVNAITGSGLSASQTNTEREGQRVIGTIGNIGDKPAAAAAALEFAKAKIDYTDAKAKAWIKARRNNPGLDRLEFESEFDATEGEQIFADANKRMGAILEKARKPSAFGGTNPADLARQELERRKKEK